MAKAYYCNEWEEKGMEIHRGGGEGEVHIHIWKYRKLKGSLEDGADLLDTFYKVSIDDGAVFADEILDRDGDCMLNWQDNGLTIDEENSAPDVAKVMYEFDGRDAERCTTIAGDALRALEKDIEESKKGRKEYRKVTVITNAQGCSRIDVRARWTEDFDSEEFEDEFGGDYSATHFDSREEARQYYQEIKDFPCKDTNDLWRHRVACEVLERLELLY